MMMMMMRMDNDDDIFSIWFMTYNFIMHFNKR